MSTSRELILARIRQAVRNAPPADAASIPRDYRRSLPDADPGQLVALFAERLRDYRATVHITDPAGVSAVIADALDARGVRRLVVPDGLPQEWVHAASAAGPAAGADTAAGPETEEGGDPDAPRGGAPRELLRDDPPLPPERLDTADGVITGCAIGIAETGTIVLDAGPGQGRRALTLVPDYHLCLVRAGPIVGIVPEAVARLDPARPLTWISGPSATSDIELNRVEGVHGPRTLEVVIVTDATPERRQ